MTDGFDKMAGRKGKKRVEPRFGGGDDIVVDPADRPTAGTKRPAAKRRRSGSGRGTSKSRARSSRKRRVGRGFSIGRLFRRSIYWGSVAAIWGLIAVVGIVAYYGMQLPSATEWAVPERPPNIQIVTVDGTLIGNRGETGGEVVSIRALPDHVPNAVIAIEDHRFRSHFGVDPIGLTRAMATNLMAGRLVQGGSTLTQQLAKNMFLTPERSFKRKVQELVLALWLETEFSKDEILEMYLNRVYFGAGAYGIDAAAHRYFNKAAEDLDVSEAAVLAGVLKAPSSYAPNRHPERAEARAALVIAAMEREGFIEKSEATGARSSPATVASGQKSRSHNYIADLVMERLPAYIGTISQDVIVETTIDSTLQRAAEGALVVSLGEKGAQYGVGEGALVAMDGTGAVRALVGGRDYAKSQFNRATQAKRQPGSAFKPFVYLAALDHGLTPDTIRDDAPITIGGWSPQNYDKKYRGPVTLRNALAFSLNTVAAKLAAEVGPQNVVGMAQRMGINSALQPNASIALGTSEVTLVELTSAYVPLANGGYSVLPHLITRIRAIDGSLLFERTPHGLGQALDLRTVAMMNDMMQATLEIGTGKKAVVPGWTAGGKTGTSQEFRDAWFVGYTANLTAGVWLGNDDNSPTKRASGGNLPTEIWSAFMQAAHDGVPVAELPGSDLILTASAPERDDGFFGRLLGLDRNDALARERLFQRGQEDFDSGGESQRGGGFFSRLFGSR